MVFLVLRWLHLNSRHALNIDCSLFIELDFSIVKAKAKADGIIDVPYHKIYLKRTDMGMLIKQNFRYRPRSFWRNIYVMNSEMNARKSMMSTWARNTESEKSPFFCWGSGLETHSEASIPLILNNIGLYFTAKYSKI